MALNGKGPLTGSVVVVLSHSDQRPAGLYGAAWHSAVASIRCLSSANFKHRSTMARTTPEAGYVASYHARLD